MNKNKRFFLFTFFLIIAITLAACGDGGNQSNDQQTEESEDVETTTLGAVTGSVEGSGSSDGKGPSWEELMKKSPDAPPGFHYECVYTAEDGSTMRQKIWAKKDKIRSEMEIVPGVVNASIVDVSGEYMYAFDSVNPYALKMKIDQKAQEQISQTGQDEQYDIPDTPMSLRQRIPTGDTIFLYREVFDGKDCLVYETIGHEQRNLMWIWEEYATPIKMMAYVGDKLKVTVEFLDFSYEEIDDKMFELPPGTIVK